MQAVGVQQVLALLVALDTALGTAHPLPGDTPEETLALVAIGRRRGGPGDKLVRRRRGDRVDHRLQRFLVHVHLLRVQQRIAQSNVRNRRIESASWAGSVSDNLYLQGSFQRLRLCCSFHQITQFHLR